MQGTVRTYLADRRFGFIESGQYRDIYFNEREIVGSDDVKRVVRPGMVVEFVLKPKPDGRVRAAQVRVLF